MHAYLIDSVALPLAASLGVFAGWFASRAVGRHDAEHSLSAEAAKIREVLAGFSRLASVVVSDVRSHKRSIAHLTDELRELELGEAKCVAEVVQELIQSNEEMEQRLLDAEQKLAKQARELEARSAEASTDTLTNLANRRAFNEELSQRFVEFEQTQRPLSVLFLDVDHFKRFNDTHGHLAGDAVLRGVAGVLRQTVRGMDMVARYGGEEFSVVLPNTPVAAAVAVAERARQAIEKMEFRYEGEVYRITVSAGVAELRSSEQIEVLLRRADECLYASKTAGRNSTHYYDGREIRSATTKGGAQSKRSGRRTRATDRKPARRTSGALPLLPVLGPELSLSASSQPSALALVCDRSAFCHAVRSRLAEWKRGGGRLTVALARIDTSGPQPVEATLQELVLSTVGRQLVAALREMDIVGVYAHDCFALLLPRIVSCDIPTVARRLHEYVRDCKIVWNDQPLAVRISLGISEAMDGDDLVRLLERAQQAVDSARAAGGERTFIHNGQWASDLESGALNVETSMQV